MKITYEQLMDAVIEGAGDIEDGETGESKCIKIFCEKLAEDASRKAFRDGALAAGIPRAVVDGERGLTAKEIIKGASVHARSALLDEMVDAGELIPRGEDMYEDMGGHVSHESNLDGHIEDYYLREKNRGSHE